jgi:micrococcal nuclease
MRWALIVALLVGLSLASAARADPCEAIPEDGPLPAPLTFGSKFRGAVTYVIDGDSLCVATGGDQSTWVEVRLSDFDASELSEARGAAAKAVLERLTLGKLAECVANLRSYDRIAARCWIDGRAIGDLMREAGVHEGGRGSGSGTRMVDEPTAGYRNCAAARAAGAAPLRRGQPGYSARLDADGDGVACEPYRGR